MEPIRVLTVFGTRPEAIKMAPLVKALEQAAPAIDSKVCVTAQHRQMLDQVLDIFQIKPDYDLDIMEPRQTLTGITVKALKGLEQVIGEVQPHIVLVHGDTTTTFVAAVAAFYQQVAIGHVEAGLRTYDKYSPFPEEMNRQLTGVMADLHFAPTSDSARNLLQENKNPDKIFVTGNTAIDAMKTTVRADYRHPILDQVGHGKRLIFMTAHRRENLGEKMENIFRAVRRIVEDHKDVALVYPVHLNPAVQEPARAILGGHPRVHLIDPLDVVDTHNFMSRSYLILTDSGGIQEEAPSLGVPVLVLRDTTERPEGIAAGTLKLAGTDEDTIYRLACELLNNKEAHRVMSIAANPYGDGLASDRIVKAILYHYGRGERPDEFEV
ncbi:non-hydrolyzing UDP-N-acetylglucosamine 2-epimerase [Effusibacillus lacus]|uniref:UDP-N-acetylglucosamine 2-epimerase (non-hydrolyzing) n=1 Tax=Effusibacillus lacus TaxID=1348429 RepID=A0A292YL15_9BACL|nr:UDP-N-acetylglucosamine 2-epimerase (non-hydrolyzing) [Effusibacillus lacus]TCS71832.1 UDP-N-acetylglucosamine 2-epimerase [Effusibacillus lacus]GAX89601.1 UDP-N-acetyl glucosamine 2-epimerase [Effusibacillus lacus]